MARLLRLYPGEKDFKEVSQKEFDHRFHPREMEQMLRKSLPPEDLRKLEEFERFLGVEKDPGFGGRSLAAGLEASLSKYDSVGGRLLEARKWPSRSYVRWIARVMRMLFSFVTETLTASDATINTMAYTVEVGSTSGVLQSPTTVERTGANMAIGDGAGAEDSGYTDLISPIDNQVARKSVWTSVEDAVQITFNCAEGITIAAPGGVTVREIGLFCSMQNTSGVQKRVLFAYDQVTPTVFTQGQVAVPKYEMDFTA